MKLGLDSFHGKSWEISSSQNPVFPKEKYKAHFQITKNSKHPACSISLRKRQARDYWNPKVTTLKFLWRSLMYLATHHVLASVVRARGGGTQREEANHWRVTLKEIVGPCFSSSLYLQLPWDGRVFPETHIYDNSLEVCHQSQSTMVWTFPNSKPTLTCLFIRLISSGICYSKRKLVVIHKQPQPVGIYFIFSCACILVIKVKIWVWGRRKR